MSIRVPEAGYSFKDKDEVTYLNQLIRVLSNSLTDLDVKVKSLEKRIYDLENP